MRENLINKKNHHGLKMVLSVVLAVASFGVSFLCFAAEQGLGEMAENVTTTLGSGAKLISGLSYVAGLMFSIISILQFKAHKDAPQSVPISKPIVYMFVAVGLLFLPGLFKKAGATLGLSEAGKIGETIQIGQ
jgi:intracellular multiplication protein IcmD